MKEIWKEIKGYEELYLISNLGRVKSIRRNIFLKLGISSKGYMYMCLQNNGNKKYKYVHQLVLEAFIGQKPNDKYECNHKDGNKGNNKSSNLEWVTHNENMQHSKLVLKNAGNVGKFGADHHLSKAYLLVSPSNEKIKITGLSKFCRENNLSIKEMSGLATGRSLYKTHRGWGCSYLL